MSWDMVAALGEIIGAIAVVATLGYLAKQIRASTLATQEAAAQDVLNGTRTLLTTIAKDPETSRVYRLGMSGGDGLSPDEMGQFGGILTLMVYEWMRIYHLHEEGRLHPWMIEGHVATRRDIVGSPGFRRWFAMRKHWISPEFRAVLEAEIEMGSEYRPLTVTAGPPSGPESAPSADIAGAGRRA